MKAIANVSAPAFQPLYRQIKTLITQSLVSGEWRPGDLIPSEIELASRFSVSQGTVRKAIRELADQNLLVRQQGQGTFLASHVEEQIKALAAERTVAGHLGVGEGTPLLVIERVAYTYADKAVELRRSYCSTREHHYRNRIV